MGEKPNKNNSKSSLDLSDLKVEEERKDFIERFSFEECKRIKEIGELYRNKSIKEISSKTDYDIETIKELILFQPARS